MFKNNLKGLGVLLAVLFLFGCALSEKIEVRRYVDVKDRVDQKMDEGNAGYLSGTPQPEDRSNIRKTRKIYVLEVSKGAGDEEPIVEIEGSGGEGSEYLEESANKDENVINVSRQNVLTASLQVAIIDPEDMAGDDSSATTPSFVEYKVEKDDTLQKISKKFYDSYSKWQKIYDANRDVIDNPDRIKPGIVIQVPME